jgi:hypothetical protein
MVFQMNNIDYYVKMWFQLLTYCEDTSNFDAKIFKQKHDEYAKRWAKQTIEQQGKICEQIHWMLTKPMGTFCKI